MAGHRKAPAAPPGSRGCGVPTQTPSCPAFLRRKEDPALSQPPEEEIGLRGGGPEENAGPLRFLLFKQSLASWDRWYCRHGMCINRELDLRPVHGEWGPWGPYSVCSRSCGGGTRSTSRDCNKPEPRNGGKFCVGRRMKFRSCNTEPCPRGRKDFREEQCSHFDGKHFNINGLPPSVRWVPKYSGILMKDRCKLFCRVAGTMAYYQLKDRVIDGTPCGTDTFDICVQGLCRQAGCDHVLNSKARNDKCGVCGGDNSSCKTLAGTFNDAEYGYNTVVRIPAGATNIDIKQVSYSGKPEDDNYLAAVFGSRRALT
ncbi:A disintegrin and metalloproteinase with thrombospondin motifs 20 [Merluccius polli]|uniref:A disintegrin and metalloproteinase with thrombospondin motifs 20 n=1 Tax=Merluccius polli TaxID=89951 RepID=A0AA47MBK1_MERPO|nr:A disintegrin and metalloproteinase with thrombospondin motifs 20 [Merluccius polli]